MVTLCPGVGVAGAVVGWKKASADRGNDTRAVVGCRSSAGFQSIARLVPASTPPCSVGCHDAGPLADMLPTRCWRREARLRPSGVLIALV